MTNPEHQVRLAVVGAGAMGANHIRAIASHDYCKLVGVIDTDELRSQELAKMYSTTAYRSIEEAVENQTIDGVVVASTTAAHFQLSNELIDHRIPFLVEKPVTDDFASTCELLRLSETYSVPMMCGFVERYNPVITTALAMLQEPVRHFLSVRHSPENPRATASVVHDLLIHDLDLAVIFNGGASDIRRVSAASWHPDNVATDEVCDSIVQFTNGTVATLSSSRRGQKKVREIRLTTDSHFFDIDLLRADLTIYRNVMQESVLDNGSINFRAQTIIDIPFVRHRGEPLAEQISHFRDLILGNVDAAEERLKIYAPHELASRIMECG